MFEYDRLALDVAQQFTASSQTAQPSLLEFSRLPAYSQANSQTQADNLQEEQSRRLSGGSTLSSNYNPNASDFFDCGASSGYGSPGLIGTPLASPAPNSAHYLAHQLQKMLLDQGFCDASSQPISKQTQATIPQASTKFWTSHLEGIYPKSTMLDGGELSCCPTIVSSPTPLHKGNNSTSRKVSLAGSEASAAPVVAVEDGFSANEIAQFAQLLCSPKKAPPTRYQCHICYQTGHYISDCPLRFNSPYEELTPYQGRKKCYGEFQCQQCKRKWTSQNSVANEAQSCIKCHVPVFPHKQLPVDKAVALGLVKSQRVLPTKISPIGHGRPETSTYSAAAAF